VIKPDRIDAKAISRDYHTTMHGLNVDMHESERERRERDIISKHDKYFDPEAFALLEMYLPRGMVAPPKRASPRKTGELSAKSQNKRLSTR